MNYYDDIREEISKFKEFILNSTIPITIFSKLSIEGIISSSILIKTLQKLNNNFSVYFFEKIDESKTKELSFNYSKAIIILDPDESEINYLLDIKEKEFLIIGKTNYSVSEKIYVLSKELDIKNTDLAYLPMLSSINAENNYILIEAEESGKIKQSKGLKIIGSNTRPIHKTIELSIEPYIMGFSGSEENTLNLLRELEIKVKTNDYWFSLQDLTDQQIEKLVNALSLIVYTKKEITGKILMFNEEERNSPLRDVNEFNLFLEAAVLYKKPSVAVAKCLLSKDYKNRALEILRDYRQQTINALSLYYTRNDSILIIEKDNCIIINFKNLISDIIIEKIVNLIQNSKLYSQKKRIIALCQTNDDKIKGAITCFNKQIDSNLKNFIKTLPSYISFEMLDMNSIVVYTNQSNETKLIELALEHLESIRIEEMGQ